MTKFLVFNLKIIKYILNLNRCIQSRWTICVVRLSVSLIGSKNKQIIVLFEQWLFIMWLQNSGDLEQYKRKLSVENRVLEKSSSCVALLEKLRTLRIKLLF